MNRQDAYRQFCRDHVHIPVFARDWYLDAVVGAAGWGAVVVVEKGRQLAAMPYCFKKKIGFAYTFMPVFVKHLGPFFGGEMPRLTEQHRLMGALIDQLPAFASVEMAFSPAVTNWLPFYWKGFQQTTRYTYRLDLTQSDLEAGINRNVRRNLQKADQELRICTDYPLELLHTFISTRFAEQNQHLPYDRDMLQRHFRALEASGAGKLFFAVDKQQNVQAAACLIWDDRCAYYHLSGDNPAFRQTGAGLWLCWQTILYTRDVLGLPIFDFEGSMMPGIEAIRRQFGAAQTPYHFVWREQSVLFGMFRKMKNLR